MTDFAMHRRAQDAILHGYLTNSKRPETFVKGAMPTHVKRGQGCWLWDLENRRYLDFICGLGTNLLGYAQTQVNGAIQEQMALGATHSLATPLEVEVAEQLKACFPFTGAWRFLKSGSDACSAAVKIARAATGRLRVASVGYHGHDDPFVSLTPPALGVPKKDGLEIELFDERTMNVGSDLAAVIVEPVVTDASDERRRWLQRLREECTRQGVLLIFDEVITGFRWPKFGVSTAWGITPDIICLGKAIANGMPLAAVGVTPQVKLKTPPETFISSTYAGETLSLASAKKTLELLLSKKFDIDWLWKRGQEFLDWFNSLYPEKIWIAGYPTRGAFTGDPLVKALFMQEASKAGMLFGPSPFLSFPAAEELPNVKGAIRAIVDKIARGEVQLEGEMPAAPFAAKVREGAK